MSARGERRWGPPLAGVALWQLVASTNWGHARSIATPVSVLREGVDGARDGTLALDAGCTLARVLAGVSLATLLGTGVAFALGARPGLWRVAEPSVDFLRSIPPVLVYPLLLLAFGYNDIARVAAVAFGACGAVLLPVATALARAPTERRDIARLAGLRGWDELRLLRLPEALPALCTGVRLALAQGLVVSVVTEMLIGADHGLGVRALAALQEYQPARLWLVVLVAGGASVALNAAVGVVERRLVRWTAW